MGFGGFLKDGLQMGFDWTSGGLTRIAGEDTLAKIPVLGAITGSKTDAQKALLKKQEELAKDAELQKKRNQQTRMQALGQSMLAFNPQNQMMAQMYGPQAAFSPQQMAQMAGDPGAKPLEEATQAWSQAAMSNPINPKTRQRDGGPIPPEVQANLERARENERRRKMIEQQTTPLGPGPAQLKLPPPQAARRY
jgi:hypothetical protein